MLGFNGGLIGVLRTPSQSSVTGVWLPNEQAMARRNSIWPTSFDPYFTNTSLLLPLNGTNGSTTLPDRSANGFTVTANGDAQISTAQSKWGGSSLLLDGSGDYLDIAGNAAFSFPGDFTIEAWIRPTSFSGLRGILELGDYSNGVLIRYTGGGDIYVNGSNPGNINSFLSVGTWAFVHVSRASNVVTVAIDGVSRLTATVSGTVNSTNAGVRIGSSRHTSGQDLAGNVQDVRITKGVARAITVPVTAFPGG